MEIREWRKVKHPMKDLSELRIYLLAVEISEAIWEQVMKWDSFAK